MQNYAGPKSRNIERYTGDNGFEKQGRVGYLEDRGIFIQQSFTIKQKKVQVDENTRTIQKYWYSEDEKELIDPQVGDYIHLSHFHTIDRLALNQTLQNVSFKPDSSFNSISIENEAAWEWV